MRIKVIFKESRGEEEERWGEGGERARREGGRGEGRLIPYR